MFILCVVSAGCAPMEPPITPKRTQVEPVQRDTFRAGRIRVSAVSLSVFGDIPVVLNGTVVRRPSHSAKGGRLRRFPSSSAIYLRMAGWNPTENANRGDGVHLPRFHPVECVT